MDWLSVLAPVLATAALYGLLALVTWRNPPDPEGEERWGR